MVQGLIVLATLLFLWRLVATIRQYRRLRHIPGPTLASLSQWWIITAIGGKQAHVDIHNMCKRYGWFDPMLRIIYVDNQGRISGSNWTKRRGNH